MAQTYNDMKVQNHINRASGGYWYRCSRVEFRGEAIRWELNLRSQYSFFDAYERTPHRQLLEADQDRKLLQFVKSWGPLYYSWPWESQWANSQPIENYRNERDMLAAKVQVLAAVAQIDMQRPALESLFEVWNRQINAATTFHPVRVALGLPGDFHAGFDQAFRDWLEKATAAQLETTIGAVVPLIASPTLNAFGFHVERTGRANRVIAETGFDGLADALHWMVWQDIFQNHPYQFCEECRKLFQPATQHAKKYCSPECAHRKTARVWQKRKREGGGGKHGT